MEIYEHYTNDFFEIERAELGLDFAMPMLHYHNAYEIMIMEKGERDILYGNKIYSVSGRDVVIIRPDAVHRNAGGTAFSRTVIYFTDKYIDMYFGGAARKQLLSCFERECVSLNDEEYACIMRNTKRIFEEYERADNYIYISLAIILRVLRGANEYSADRKNNSKNLMLIKAMRFIEDNYMSIENISDISDSLHITKQYLCRLMKKGTGLTVTRYLNSVRIRRACEMLVSGEKTVTEICYECGFNSSTYFCKIFKQIMNMTPIEYRGK